MRGYGKLILFIGAVLLCAVGAILSLAFANSIEHDGGADALKTAGDVVENQGMISSYSIGIWTNHLDDLRYGARHVRRGHHCLSSL